MGRFFEYRMDQSKGTVQKSVEMEQISSGMIERDCFLCVYGSMIPILSPYPKIKSGIPCDWIVPCKKII
jgi:hypothetical protein